MSKTLKRGIIYAQVYIYRTFKPAGSIPGGYDISLHPMGPFSNPGGSSYIADSIQLDVKTGNYAGGSANKFDNCRFICPDHQCLDGHAYRLANSELANTRILVGSRYGNNCRAVQLSC